MMERQLQRFVNYCIKRGYIEGKKHHGFTMQFKKGLQLLWLESRSCLWEYGFLLLAKRYPSLPVFIF